MFHSYGGTLKMKTQIVYLTIVLDVLSLTTLQIYSQSRLPEYKDTSQTITRDELILEQTRLSKERQAKRQVSKIKRQESRDSFVSSNASRKDKNLPKKKSK